MAFGILFPFLIYSSEIKEYKSIPLYTFGGVENVLLKWDLPEYNDISSVRIYRSDDMMSSFELIELEAPFTNRYLDDEIISDEILFYKLEIETIDGIILQSSQETPSVVRVKRADNYNIKYQSLKYEYPILFNSGNDISDISELKTLIMHDYISKKIPIEIENPYGIIMYFLIDDIQISSYLNILSISDFNALKLLFNENGQTELISYFSDAFNDFEALYRNRVYLTKNEWDTEKVKSIKKLNKKFISAHDIYKDDIIFLESIAPARITGLSKDSISTNISVLLKDKVIQNVMISIDDEVIELDASVTRRFDLPIPKESSNIELLIDNRVTQSVFNFNNYGTMVISLDDQYLFKDEDINLKIMKSIPFQQYQLNEIAYDTTKKVLKVEIASNADETKNLGMFVNEKLIWEWIEYSSFETTFTDSSWTLNENSNQIWIHLCMKNDLGNWEIMESRPIDLEKSYKESKVPDLGEWTNLSFSSFGESNDITQANKSQQIIPEIFALYQNYPNPFNNFTKISFDLLEESTVSLYVTDARGRKLHVFLEEIYLETGSYSFDWSAEYHSSGVYFITLQAQSGEYLPVVMSRKMIYLK